MKTHKRLTLWPKASFAALDETAIEMTQALLPAPGATTINVLRHVGFRHLADLLYLTCEAVAISAGGSAVRRRI